MRTTFICTTRGSSVQFFAVLCAFLQSKSAMALAAAFRQGEKLGQSLKSIRTQRPSGVTMASPP